MDSSLALSSFFIMHQRMYTTDEWAKRIRRDLDTLTSLSGIDFQRKYYFDCKDDKLYQSSWAIADYLKEWLGDWATKHLSYGEEVLYRKVWQLSINDTIEGILRIKRTLVRTLAIASRSIIPSEDREVDVDLQVLERQIVAIQSVLELAKLGLMKLNETYSQSVKKNMSLKPVVDNFYTEINTFCLKLLAQINTSKVGFQILSVPIQVLNAEAQDPAGQAQVLDVQIPEAPEEHDKVQSFVLPIHNDNEAMPDSQAELQSRVPVIIDREKEAVSALSVSVKLDHAAAPLSDAVAFLGKSAQGEPMVDQIKRMPLQGDSDRSPCVFLFNNPDTVEQKKFNTECEQNFQTMKKYLEENLPAIEEELTACKVMVSHKRAGEARPWTVRAYKEGKKYLHYHISIVPQGKGGKFKIDKRGYNITDQCDVAKLSSKLYSEERIEVANNEEKFLTICAEANLPNVVKAFDIIWEHKEDVWKQIIYLKYCSRGELTQSLARLKNEPEKMKRVMIGILRGLAALHSKNIVHRDLKPSNIFLDDRDEPHIGDFGGACIEDEDAPLICSPLYMDPYVQKGCNKKHIDIWSLGMIFYGLLSDPTDPRPWSWLKNAKKPEDVLPLTKKYRDSAFPEPPVDNLWLHACWEMLQEPSKRPTAEVLLERFEPKAS